MNDLFDYDGKLAHALQKIFDGITASVLWIIGCLPLITIGTSTTALYYASMKSILGEGKVAKNYFHSYKENALQSIVVEIILLIVGYIMYINWKIIVGASGGGIVLKVVYFAVLLWLAPVVCYIFPILARFALPTRMLFVNAFVLSFKNLPKTIFILLTTLLPIVCLVIPVNYLIALLPLLILILPALISNLNARMFLKLFEQYMPKEED